MAESFFTALQVVAPICIMMLCGLALRKAQLITPGMISGMNKLIFRLFLPANLFLNCYSGRLNAADCVKMVVFCCAAILLMFLLYIPVSRWTDPSASRRSVILQAAFRGNLAMFGVPVLTLLYGSDQLGPMAVLLAFMIPELNVLATLCFEVFSDHQGNIHAVLCRLVKNPLIQVIVLGLTCNLLRLSLPKAITGAMSSLGSAATPLAFVMLGASFHFSAALANRNALTAAIAGKLLLLPLAALGVGVIIGLRGVMLASAVTLFGSPVAVSSVPMAEELGGDTALASEAVVLSTFLGVFTMFGWIFLLSYLQLI